MNDAKGRERNEIVLLLQRLSSVFWRRRKSRIKEKKPEEEETFFLCKLQKFAILCDLLNKLRDSRDLLLLHRVCQKLFFPFCKMNF